MQTPVLQALVLADWIYTDESGKRIICGTFSKIYSLEFPASFGRPTWAFILLTDVLGNVVLQLRFVSLSDNQILLESAPVELESPDKLEPIDIAMQIPPFPLPHEGAYAFECFANQTMIGSVRLQVIKAQKPGDHQND